jgi:signal transduction histidine kinase/ligand-binding sensor domain-containing protein
MSSTLSRNILILFFLVCIPGMIHAQLNSDNLVLYTEKEGLPASRMTDLEVDRHGFIWVGTDNGMARFDGYEFKRFYFDPNDTATFHGLLTWSIFEDRSGLVWAGAGPSYLNAYNPVSKKISQKPFVHLLKRRSFSEVDVRSVEQDKRGRLYFGLDTYYGDRISNALVYKDENDDSLMLFKTPDSIDISNVIRIRINENDEVWILTYTGILRIDKDRRISTFKLLDSETFAKNDDLEDIVFDSKGKLWCISSSLKLFEVEPTFDRFSVHDLPDLKDDNRFNYAAVLMAEENGNLWIGSDGGLSYFDKGTNKILKFNSGSKKHLGNLGISSLAKDGFGNVWAGSIDEGLLKYEDKPQFKSFTYKQDDPGSITNGWASMIQEKGDGSLWVTTGSSNQYSGVNHIDLKTWTIQPFRFRDLKPALSNVNGMWINEAGDITLQAGLMEGSQYVRRFFSFSTSPQFLKPLTGAYPDSLFTTNYLKDSNGTEWFCSFVGLLKKEKGSAGFIRLDLSQIPGSNVSSNEVTRVVESQKYGLWIQTNNGLFQYDYNTGKISRHGFDQKDGDVLITHDINSLYEDENGIVWLGTWQGGLARYDVNNKKIKIYTRDDGLPSMSVQAILPHTKSNSLWLSTFEGLSRFDVKTETFNNFSLADGIQGLLFADGGALITKDGHYVFGGNNGVTIFKPEEIGKVSTPPRVMLTDFKLFNKSVLPGEGTVLKKPIFETEQFTLKHDQNNISFEFIAIHYSNPSKNKYAYKLENYDNEWLEVGSLHTAFYPNLPPGDYVFRVKAANDQGVWNEKGVSVKITVLPPWWKTLWAYLGYALLFGVAVFFMDRYFRHRVLEKEREKNRNRELEQAKEIQKAYSNLEQAHEALKATQNQLVQSEKMASLGELTAGIAHEIQNPLNFVNNFSEVNKELADELIEAAEKGDLDEIRQLADSIRLNEERIRAHGKRADSIVKSMLMHSRSNSGQKEPVDLNALVDEYVRLSYHGMRAKDKEFNVALDTTYDDKLGKVNVIQQEIGRVILNLVNNAFYAVSEMKKRSGAGFEPKVSITTRVYDNGVEIIVMDNGTGIPESIKEKIMQPFFTTKPTGEGTGLGLSLSYDIIKAHGGEIKLETPGDGGTRFIVRLPVHPSAQVS